MVQRFADMLVLSWGWRRAGLAAVLGALGAASQAPLHAFPVLFLSMPALVWLLDGALAARQPSARHRFRAAALVGWWFGFGYFLAGLWWIGDAFLVEAEDFGWLMPFAVLLMPAGLAFFWALATGISALFWREDWRRVLMLAVALSMAEWLRGHVFTGFPWNALGYGFAANTLMMQPVALVGIYGLTFVAILTFAAPAVLIDRRGGAGNGAVRFAVVVFLICAGFIAAGGYRLTGPDPAPVPDTTLRIVQPAVAQQDKWVPENRGWIFRRYLEMSVSGRAEADAPSTVLAGLAGVTTLIWPESVFPFLLTEQPDALAALATLLPEGTSLLTGAVRAEGEGADRDYYNAIYAIDAEGTILDAYDKVHLVPFGEYLPFQSVLESIGLESLTRLKGGFTPGFRRRTMSAPGLPAFSPLICYEIAFPHAVIPDGPRPQWMLNLTNDAWFGETSGPYQHLHQARVRAVEEGLPVVRAANTGISAVIDARGRVLASIPLGEGGVLDAALPGALPVTPYARWGDLPFGAMVLLGIAILLGTSRRRVRG